MTETELFHSFRAPVAAPSRAARDAAHERLLDAMRGDIGATRSGRLSRRRAGAAVVAVAALVGIAVVGLWDGAPSVVERAEATLDPQGRILHVLVRIEAADGSVTRGESWIRPNGTGRSLEPSSAGTADCVASPIELRCYDAARNVVDVYRYHPEAVQAAKRYAGLPGFRVDQPESIHRAFASGYARFLGETKLDGRAVYEVRLAVPFIDANGKATPRFDEATSPILYLDLETYYPIAERFPDAGSTTFYETYEFLPAVGSTVQLLELPTNAETRVVVHPIGEGPQG
jgi:hypothetical protein